jgi:hypothetical protein
MRVSLYKNLYDTEGVSAPLITVLNSIKEGRWKKTIEAHRAGEINAKMNGTLPAFTVGGVFHPKRTAENLYKHSGLMSFDLDDVSDKHSILNKLKKDKLYEYIYSIFISTGGRGLCLLVKYAEPKSPHEHKEYYTAFYEVLNASVGDWCKLDYLPDISRLRFVTYDPELLLRDDSTVWDQKVEVDEVFAVPKQLSTDTFYEDDTNKLIEFSLSKYVESVGDFGANGKPRHDWILGLGRYLCRAGVDEYSATSYCLSNFNNPDRDNSVWIKEVERCIKSSYARYSAEMGSYAPTKSFDYEAINSSSNIEDVLFQLLLYIKDKEKYVEYMEKNKKDSKFAKRELQFVKGLYYKIKKYI